MGRMWFSREHREVILIGAQGGWALLHNAEGEEMYGGTETLLSYVCRQLATLASYLAGRIHTVP